MERTLRNIIEPTIRKKFRGLHVWSRTISRPGRTIPPYYDEVMGFRDDDDNEFIYYNITENELIVDYEYFMLKYFGNIEENKELLKEIFVDLLNDYFEKTGEVINVDKDVTFELFYY